MNRIPGGLIPLVRNVVVIGLVAAAVTGLVPDGAKSAQTPRDIVSSPVTVVVEPGAGPAAVADRPISGHAIPSCTDPSSGRPAVATDETFAATATPVVIDPGTATTATPAGPTPFPIVAAIGSANTNAGITALDRDPTSMWRAETGRVESGASLTLDLGFVRPAGVVRWMTPLTGPTGGLTLQVSEDGERWMTVGQPDWWDVDTGWRVWEIDVAARYVRFAFTNRDERLTLGGLTEVEIYAATALVRPLVIDTPTPVPAAPTLVSLPPGASAGGDAPLPTAPPETPATDEPLVPSDPPATNAPEPALGG